MPLTKEQINEIKQFIHSRGFTTIEVEMEILDHVASAVEAKLEAQPNKSITKAIQEVHAGFGIMGFSTIEDEKKKYFHTLIKRQIWKSLKDYTIGHNSWITVLLLVAISSITLLFKSNEIFLRIFPFALGISVVIFAYASNYKKFRKWKNKSLMLSVAGYPLLIIQPNFGNFIGIFSDEIYGSGSSTALALYIGLNLLMTIFTLAGKETMNWGFNWTNERYLKYA